MTRYTGYVISHPDDDGKPLFGIIEDEGTSSSLLLPVPSGESHVHILNPSLDQETARLFRKKHGGNAGNWEVGNPDDLIRAEDPKVPEPEEPDDANKGPQPNQEPEPTKVPEPV